MTAPVVDPETLVPSLAVEAVRRVYRDGHGKYAALDNGQAEDPRDAAYHVAKALSHLAEYRTGSKVDEDSGEHPLAHVASRVLLALELELRGRR